jgi:RNA polymerase sigma-70 factor (ECF subfamily)
MRAARHQSGKPQFEAIRLPAISQAISGASPPFPTARPRSVPGGVILLAASFFWRIPRVGRSLSAAKISPIYIRKVDSIQLSMPSGPVMRNRIGQSEAEVSSAGDSQMAALHQKSRAREFGLSLEQFSAILDEIQKKLLTADASAGEKRKLYESLRIEELVLARACAAGNELAWETFLLRYREKLYDVAGYIAKEGSAARELADSLYADLYGTRTRDGKRISKLASYTGRGSLEGWLRTVMAQEYVNRYRRGRRLVSLDEESGEGVQFASLAPQPSIAVDRRIEEATDQALGQLSAEDRFVLASYYLDGRTLADIARLLSLHESTISRKLDKLAKSMRKRILASLRERGMSRRQAEESLQVDVRDMTVNIRRRLTQESVVEAFFEKKVNARAGDPKC